jgi:CHASE3 domain sensor protein
MEINQNLLNIVTALILLILIVGISFYWSTLYSNPIAQKIKRQMDFHDALLRSFQQSHPNFKDCNWQGPDIVCKSE